MKSITEQIINQIEEIYANKKDFNPFLLTLTEADENGDLKHAKIYFNGGYINLKGLTETSFALLEDLSNVLDESLKKNPKDNIINKASIVKEKFEELANLDLDKAETLLNKYFKSNEDSIIVTDFDIDRLIKELDNEIDKCKNNNNNIDDKNDDIIFKP